LHARNALRGSGPHSVYELAQRVEQRIEAGVAQSDAGNADSIANELDLQNDQLGTFR
jgi:hypothetical protein